MFLICEFAFYDSKDGFSITLAIIIGILMIIFRCLYVFGKNKRNRCVKILNKHFMKEISKHEAIQ
jgi:hypothetical protein